MKKLMFTRVGGLSPVTYKPVKGKEPTFHYPPPRRKGIYAFVWPYVEPYLFAWSKENCQEFETNGYRQFQLEGMLWCHFLEEAKPYAIEQKGSWVKVHTKDFPSILKQVMKRDIRCLQQDKFGGHTYTQIDDPYKRGRGGFMSRDHLEVFIEASECGKIR